MNRFCRRILLGIAILALLKFAPAEVAGQTNPSQAPLPPVPPLPSRTKAFRKLLEMSAAEREQSLSNRPSNIRVQLEAKIREYTAMAPADRETRLRATELHEYLQYFIGNPPGDRATQLAMVPEEYRLIVSNRLTQFDLLPPPLRLEALARESTSNYFVGPGLGAAGVPPHRMPPMPPDPLQSLAAIAPAEREKIYAGFASYFDLSDDDKQQVLALIPASERPRVTRTLTELDKLPKDQRIQGLQAINSLVGMNEDQRRLFFQNLERWKTMSPAERETWLKVVSHLPPMPPTPVINSHLVPPPPRPPLSAFTNPTD